jgi:hypothetical protein
MYGMKASEALTLLINCEKDLRRLLGEAAAEGDYCSAERITQWARAVAALAGEGNSWQPAPVAASAASERKMNGKSVGGSSARSVTDVYPKFLRRGDDLVRIGWSKTERREYVQRAPKVVVDAVAGAVKNLGVRARLFNGDALLPLKNGSNGGSVPDYQVYLALGWLKDLGVLQQRGRRGGYSWLRDKQIDSAITAAWPGLAEWQG